MTSKSIEQSGALSGQMSLPIHNFLDDIERVIVFIFMYFVLLCFWLLVYCLNTLQ